ncbi:hypothetical protein HPB48_025606 [Haemaphysalis longicornis]|uniref:Cleavage stimulation factor subunit 1 dimerisation domain-containing protein n=1 Tax=Haemaphysalis longicornis TaxID=44386 RepID=A0A9J6H980_HAELO|nr:hypothetical protein HPB48_025606 [Haemaphysalis longicornis]
MVQQIQLFYDGHQTLAVSLSNMVKAHPACPPSDRLLNIVSAGLRAEQEAKGSKVTSVDQTFMGPGIDLEYETEAPSLAPEPALYETCYVTSHKAQCRAGTFSRDGQLVATGSADASIRDESKIQVILIAAGFTKSSAMVDII